MSNEYFQPGSVPAPNAPGSSAVIRGEFTSVANAFDKLPVMAGHADEFVIVNPSGTGLVTSGFTFNLIPIANGGTGATTVELAQIALGIDLKADIESPAFTGAPSGPTPPTGDTSARLATTFFVTNTLAAVGAMQPGDDAPLMNGIASPGTDPTRASRQDHIHPSDTSRAPLSAGTAVGTTFSPVGSVGATNVQAAIAELDTEKAPLASPTFTGVPLAPTVADVSDTTTKIATTAWVQNRLVMLPVGVQVSDTPPLGLNTTAVAGVGVEASRYDHRHPFPTATNIPNTPAGTIAATTVQAALNELDTEKSPVGHTHVAANITNLTATNVPFTPAGTVSSTNVQTAIAEVAADAVQRTGATGAAIIPTGNTAARPGSPAQGYFRRNSELAQWEGYDGANWTGIGGASGGGGNPFCYENDITVSVNYTITTNKNAMSAGPISIASGVTVTVPSGSVWSIV